MSADERWPICNHKRTGLVSETDPRLWATHSPRRSSAVCERPRCQADAISWVQAGTGEKAAYYSDAERGIK